MKMDKSMSKIFTKLLSQQPLSNKEGLDIDTIDDEKFEFVPCFQFFMDFRYKTFKDFLCHQIALTRSIFELEKCK